MKNIIWQNGSISKDDLGTLNNCRSCVIWLTGLSGAGKSTIANALKERLFLESIQSYILDGDNMRHGLNKNLGFTPEDRKENIRRIAEVAKLFVDAGLVVMVAAISPYREDRKLARDLLEAGEFIEIHVNCALDICETRDVKGLYKKARSGEIKEFTGITAPYEEPDSPEIAIKTDQVSIGEAVELIFSYLKEKKYIQTK